MRSADPFHLRRPVVWRQVAWRPFVWLLLFSVLPAGTAEATAGFYLVRKGDSLSVIARRFGTTVQVLKQDNALTRDTIQVGQRLALARPFGSSTRTAPVWTPPLHQPGAVLRPYGTYGDHGIRMSRTGTDVACPIGTPFFSPALGIVRHSGPMAGYGHLLIIEHAAQFATVFAPCDPDRITVVPGQAVLGGDQLGLTGAPIEPDSEPYLHLELRHRDRAVTPDRLLK
jgi:murein DD-endopeptidase MepM/ murein hydrolase activator NlpD